MSKNFHTFKPKEALAELDSDEHGISSQEAKRRLEKYGRNEISREDGRSAVIILLSQFTNSLVYILLAAAAISFAFDKMLDFYVILGVLVLNAVIGFVQEYRAEKALQALQEMVVPKAKVYRNGKLKEISARHLVPGDVVLLQDGDRIPADGRILEAKNLRTMEAALTGESTPVDKTISSLPAETGVSDQTNMARLGTYVANGEAKVVVTSTGDDTAFGKIAKDISEIEEKKTHFEEKVDTLVKQMGAIAVGGAAIIFVVGFFFRQFGLAEISLFTIAALVSGIPEGLPAVLAVVLAIGARRMASKNAIIRNMPSTETLGVTNTIVTDKTGTLTQNTMTIRKIFTLDEGTFSVSGEGWEPEGRFYQQEDQDIIPMEKESLKKLLYIGASCNSSQILKEEDKESYKVIGSPTEASLLVLAKKAGIKRDALFDKFKQEDEIPFSTKLKYRASLFSVVEQEDKELFVVGAPEKVIEKSQYIFEEGKREKLTDKKRKQVEEKTEEFAQQAMRTLALAYKPVDKDKNSISDEDVEELTLVGVVGMKDPARPSVKDAIEAARKAGVRTVMCTGDHKDTAVAIAKEVGLIDENEKNPRVLTEIDLKELSKEEFLQVVKEVNVFARLTPHMKLKIAETLQGQGNIVAMTGDGVNDAPALKKADIGIAMGITGTDVAREASDMVLTDDNFASIVDAIREGRVVFTNTQQAGGFLVTTNFAEDVTLIAALLLGFPLPLLATQILWINLVTDGVSDVALAAEPDHNNILDKPPHKKGDNILSKELIPFILIMVGVMATLALFVFYFYLPNGLANPTTAEVETARTAVFLAIAFTQLFNLLNMRSMEKSLFEIGVFSNKYITLAFPVVLFLQFLAIYWFNELLKLKSLPFIEVIVILILSSSVLWVGELYKFFRSKSRAA